MLTKEQWVARELAKAPALTEQQQAALRRILCPASVRRAS